MGYTQWSNWLLLALKVEWVIDIEYNHSSSVIDIITVIDIDIIKDN